MTSAALKIIINAAALCVACWLFAGVKITTDNLTGQIATLLAVGLILGVINTFIKPLVVLMALPAYLLTLGLITFVVNAGLLLLVSEIAQGLNIPFEISGFGTALMAAVVVSLVGWLLHAIIPED